MRILHVVDYVMPTLGYQEFLLPKWNAKHGHEVDIITSDRYYPVPDYEETWGRSLGPRLRGTGRETIDGVGVHRLPVRWEVKARPWLIGLERAIGDLRPDVIFCHGTASPTAFRVARLSKTSGVPALLDNHMTFTAQNRSLHGRAYYRALRAATGTLLSDVYRFLGVAHECCDFLQQEQGIAPERVECLPLGVDTELFRPDAAARARLRREHGIPADARVVLQTGKLSPDKSPYLLATTLAPLMRRDPGLWLVFVGSGSDAYLAQVREPLKSAGVSDRTLFVPFVPASELGDWYSVSDLCVYPAASSLSCLEAAACARAVVMTDLPAGRWRAEQGIGVCFRAGDAEDLGSTIQALLSDPASREAVAERGREAVERLFSYDAVARRSEELMTDAISSRRAPRRNRAELGRVA